VIKKQYIHIVTSAALICWFQSYKTYGFTPHDSVLEQDPLLLWTRILSNVVIAIACFTLFLVVRHFLQFRKEHSHPLVFWLLGLLLLAFGALHIIKLWGLFQPLYWIMGSIEACTAAIALLAAIAFYPLVPRTLKLKGAADYDKVNKQLHDSEKHLEVLLSGIKDYAIFMLDPLGTVVTWNEGAQRIKGYKAEEIIGKNFSCFFRPEDRENGRPTWELNMAREMGRYEEEGLRVRKDGSQFWADIIITSLYNQSGQLTGFAKVTRDITEKKEAIQVLEEQAALFDLFNDAIIVRDLDGTIRYWNGGAQKMYGYTEKECINQKTHELLKTEFPTTLAELEEDVLAKGHWNGELTHYRKDGGRITVESRQALKTDPQDHSVSIVEINTDITARKEAEQKQSMLAEMERVNIELERFAAVASHDLQEPLRAIAGCLQILEKTYKGRLDSNADELIQFAIDGAQRMRNLINDLLSLSRVDREEMTFSTTDVPEVIERVKTDLATAIKESNATITYNKLPALSANKTLLTQLFQNLISNAIKFRGDRPPQIHIDASRQNGQWLFSVSDNGIGFEQTYADRIFQPFKRLHSKDKYPGTGIGLPICKRIIERHGGKIWAESHPGKGTVFNFTISEMARSKNGN